MIRKHKKYSRPRKPFDGPRITEENEIRKEYGLKNKKEIWRAEALVGKMRLGAKRLTTASIDEQEKFIETLKRRGLNVSTIAEVLGLTKKDLMNRRLQTIVSRKFAVPMKKSRQLITHKKVSVKGSVVNIPSYIVFADEEDKIKMAAPKEKVNKKVESNEVAGELTNE